MSVKIQINSRDALERLLGNDEEMEVEVRKAVIEAFARGFIKNVNNNAAIVKEAERQRILINDAITKEIENEVAGSKANRRYSESSGLFSKTSSFTLNNKIVSEIRRETKRQIRLLVHDAVESIQIQDMVAAAVQYRVDNAIRAAVRQAIENNITERIRVVMHDIISDSDKQE